jgi:CheY-like chemotaxis protein
MLLELEGYPVAVAANGREALDYLQQHETPGLIIMDIVMPEMDGRAFRAAQRQDPRLADIPVVVYSATASTQDRAAFQDVVGFYDKPANPIHVVDLAKRYC